MSYVIKGKAFWSKVYEHNAQDGKYSLDLSIDDKTAKFLTDLGLKVKTTNLKGEVDERGTHVTFSKYMTDFDGNKVDLKVMDSQMNPMTELIGNGSEVNIEFYPRKYGPKSRAQGKWGQLEGVQVLELVEYQSGDALGVVEGGYVKGQGSPTVTGEVPFDTSELEDEVV